MKITNGILTAEISEKGAECVYLKDQKGYQYMFNRDEKYWKNCTPTLFPQTSKAFGENGYEVDGKHYELGNHGFARYATFKLKQISEKEVEAVLDYDENTLAQYPYKFKLTLNYLLEDNKVWLNYKVENLDNKEMPFQLGMHPAFLVPVENSNSIFDDYTVHFEKEENLVSLNGCIDLKQDLPLKGNVYFSKELSSFFKNYQSDYVSCSNGDAYIEVGTKGFKWVGLWHKSADAPFICIEPWFGHGYSQEDHIEMDEQNFVHLKPGQVYHCSYYWKFGK